MLHLETVLASTLDLLKTLQGIPELSQMRLVGGTSLALQIGHRTSVDLDLFGSFDPMRSFRRMLLERGCQADGAESGEVQTLSVNGVKVDLVDYPYGWISGPIHEDGITLAGLDDIVAMKLSAAANRGKKKDFIDLAVLLERYSLPTMFRLYQTKFQIKDIAYALRGLTYFDDAEGDPMPKMFSSLTWKDAKNRISAAVRGFVKFV